MIPRATLPTALAFAALPFSAFALFHSETADVETAARSMCSLAAPNGDLSEVPGQCGSDDWPIFACYSEIGYLMAVM